MAIIVSKKGSQSAQVVNRSDFALERNLQDYICDHPEAIPVEDKRLPVVARELQTESGAIDAFAVDKDGDLYIVETKLYRNPDKRTVVAQALDYGASLWRHADFNQLLSTLEEAAERQWKMPFRDKLAEFFSLDEGGVDTLIESMRRTLSDGRLKFVVLMDRLEDRLKDLITYVNENSEFDIYAVQIELYKHEDYEIVIGKTIEAGLIASELLARGDAQRLPALQPDRYSNADQEFLVRRTVELTCTTYSMMAFAADMGFTCGPFTWDDARRHCLRTELDAYYAHMYELTRDELRYVLDPRDVFGAEFPSETFRVLKEREIKEYGEYRTQRLVLEAYDELAKSDRFRDEMPHRLSAIEATPTTVKAKSHS